MATISVQELREKQKELCDSFILDTDKMDEIMRKHTQKMVQGEFHNYSINNILLADFQLYMRTGETTELLAPYKRWNKINRYVKKGSKALYILAPIFYEEEQEDGTIESKVWFKRVPVYDLSMTDGEKFEPDYVKYEGNITFQDIIERTNIEVIMSNKEITRGYTDGKKIWISKHISDPQKVCVFFHELTHYKLHFGSDRDQLTKSVKELDAEAVSFMISSVLGIKNEESGAYIRGWAGSNAPDEIKGHGSKLIRTAQEIIDEMKLCDLLESKS
ncbi:ArdC-like ssDNA-binding domain-containing protein [Methanobrevibacter sp.]|uniref:ArdC-like ssDNA-binding domain-containing protein n=1 Tax=Methanobrevibacter sp. TaxID=66852 RepID=UPI00386CC728